MMRKRVSVSSEWWKYMYKYIVNINMEKKEENSDEPNERL